VSFAAADCTSHSWIAARESYIRAVAERNGDKMKWGAVVNVL
jgi:hypothetical protein